MSRRVVSLVLLLLFSTSMLRGEPPPPEAPAKPAPAEPYVIRLTLRPAAAPVPALKYQLLTPLDDQIQDNAVLHYYRAGIVIPFKFLTNKEFDWVITPPKDVLPLSEVRDFLATKRKMLHEVEIATRCTQCNWDHAKLFTLEDMDVLYQELQYMRHFALILKIKARLELAEGHPEQALQTLRAGFTLVRHFGESPYVISARVSLAIAHTLKVSLEEVIQAPACPNLYWALTDFPQPFIDKRKSLQGERLFAETIVKDLRKSRSGPMAPAALKAILEAMGRVMINRGESSQELVRQMLETKVMTLSDEAKKMLVALGIPQDKLEAMPKLQASLLYELYLYDVYYDEMIKWQNVPYWQAEPALARLEARLEKDKKRNASGVDIPLASLLLPSFSKFALASARIERYFAALRCIEAIRLYAASHDGNLPPTLDAIQEVPIPLDPVTGKAFEYQAKGNQATLSAPPPAGQTANPGNALRYELTLTK